MPCTTGAYSLADPDNHGASPAKVTNTTPNTKKTIPGQIQPLTIFTFRGMYSYWECCNDPQSLVAAIPTR